LLAAGILNERACDLIIFIASQYVKLLHGNNEPANGIVVVRFYFGRESVSVFVDGIYIGRRLETLIIGFKHF
jgi:hypothetical protein